MKAFGEKTKARSFTLVELMCVVAIIMILVSMLLSAMVEAKRSAERVICLSNQRALVKYQDFFPYRRILAIPENSRCYDCHASASLGAISVGGF